MSSYKYDKNWYNALKKPPFQPPAWIFAPVWTLLYITMALSLLLILTEPFGQINMFAYVLFILQLILNFSWSPTFFKFHQIKKAFFICLLLTITVFIMVIVFYYISNLAALILIPYLLWISFASILNFSLWRLNREE